MLTSNIRTLHRCFSALYRYKIYPVHIFIRVFLCIPIQPTTVHSRTIYLWKGGLKTIIIRSSKPNYHRTSHGMAWYYNHACMMPWYGSQTASQAFNIILIRPSVLIPTLIPILLIHISFHGRSTKVSICLQYKLSLCFSCLNFNHYLVYSHSMKSALAIVNIDVMYMRKIYPPNSPNHCFLIRKQKTMYFCWSRSSGLTTLLMKLTLSNSEQAKHIY